MKLHQIDDDGRLMALSLTKKQAASVVRSLVAQLAEMNGNDAQSEAFICRDSKTDVALYRLMIMVEPDR